MGKRISQPGLILMPELVFEFSHSIKVLITESRQSTKKGGSRKKIFSLEFRFEN
jgi:hypothetical protein